MNKRHAIMLGLIALGLMAENVKQHFNYMLSLGQFYTLTFLIDAVMVWAIVGVGRIRPREPRSTPSFVSSALFLVGAFTLGLIAANLSREAFEVMSPGIGKEMIAAGEHSARPGRPAIGHFYTMIAGPIMEEIVFRMGIIGALVTFMTRPLAIVLSCAAFALAHFAIYPPAMWMPVFFVGILCAVTYLTLGLQWAIALHILYNTQPHHLGRITSDFGAAIYFVAAIVGIIIFLLTLRKNFNAQESNRNFPSYNPLRASLRRGDQLRDSSRHRQPHSV